MDIKKQDEVTLFAEGLLNIIIDFYDKAKSLNLGVILDMPFCALIAGQGCDSTSKLISVSFIRRKLSYNEVAMALYPPCDAKMDDCCQIFATNYNMHHDDFCEHTVKGIAAISQAVSPSGHVWTFDKKDCKGRMTEF